jgi:hypothetical protein
MRADCLPHVSVAIHVNGNALHEHHADSEETAVCCVEAVSGAEFSVVLKVGPDYAYRKDSLQFQVSLDGSDARSRIITLSRRKGSYTTSIDSVRRRADGHSYYRKFTSAQHETSMYLSHSNVLWKSS